MSNLFKKAPMELAGEFLSAVMKQDYATALVLCQTLLIFEPKNPMYLEYEKLLTEAKYQINQDASLQDQDDTDSDSDGDYNNDSDSSSNSDLGDSINEDENNNDIDEASSTSDETNEDESEENEDDDSADEEDELPDLSKLNLLMGGFYNSSKILK